MAAFERGWHENLFGTGPAESDATGRLKQKTPKVKPAMGITGPAPVLGALASRLDGVAKEKGETKAVTDLQARLNKLRDRATASSQTNPSPNATPAP